MKKFVSLLLSIVLALTGCAAAFALCNYALNYSQTKYEKKPPQELTELGSPNKVYFNELSNIEKHTYNAILSEIYDFPESITIPQVTELQLRKVNSALLYDNPDIFFYGGEGQLISKLNRISFFPEYIISESEYAAQKEELDKVCDKVISSLTKPEDEWQTEFEIHNYIIDNCKYKLVEGNLVYSSVYGALVNGEAACEGYSKAAKLLLNKAGIECSVVCGNAVDSDGESQRHMWNAVKINGDCYYLDCTWDDPVSADGSDTKLYDFFNVNEEMISLSHSDISGGFECSAMAENYYIKTGRYFETYDRSDEKRLAKLLADELNGGSDSVRVLFGSLDVYNQAVEDLFSDKRIYNVLALASKETDKKFSLNSVYRSEDCGRPMLSLVTEKK